MRPIAYFKLVMLSNDLKEKNRIKIGATIPRFDCTLFSGDYEGIKPFVNSKGMFYLNLFQTKNIIKANAKRLSEFVLKGNGLNFTSMYFENILITNICYGYPNSNPLLANGNINPLFKFRNDLYIIVVNDEMTELEILIFKTAKAFASDLLQQNIDGIFDDDIAQLRMASKSFFKY